MVPKFDDNYRPALWSSKQAAQQAYQQILSLTDIAFLTFDDEQLLHDDIDETDAIARTQQYGVNEIVIKRGADACFVIIDNERIEVPANKINHVVDTTAAGGFFQCRLPCLPYFRWQPMRSGKNRSFTGWNRHPTPGSDYSIRSYANHCFRNMLRGFNHESIT